MLRYFGKSVVWMATSAIGLVVGIAALIYSKSGWAETTGKSTWLPPHCPPHHDPPVVPEVNTGLVLLPIVLAIFVFTSRQLWRRRGLENQ